MDAKTDKLFKTLRKKGIAPPLVTTKENLESLRTYCYSSEDCSAIYPYLKPSIVFLAQFIPKYVRPNTITSVGILVNVFIYILSYFYCTDTLSCNVDTPAYFYIAVGVLIYTYFTLDALDGEQGKRIGTYTPTWACPSTELFDHGADSLSTSLLTIVSCCALQLNPTIHLWPCIAVVWLAQATFYSSTWESTYIGKMRFPAGISNPTEGICMTVMFYIFTGIFTTAWTLKPFSFMSLNFTTGELFAVVLCISALYGVYGCFDNVFKKTERERAMQSLWALIPFANFSLYLLCFYLFFDQELFVQLPRFYLLLPSLQVNHAVVFLIITETAKQKFEWLRVMKHQLVMWIPLICNVLLGWNSHLPLYFSFCVTLVFYARHWLSFWIDTLFLKVD